MKRAEQRTFRDLGVEWIGLELNNTCNARCTFCPISKDELRRFGGERLMSYEMAAKIIDEVKEDGSVSHVILNNYGEPFLYPRLEDVLRLCKQNGIRVRFGTNGTQFSGSNVDLLRRYEPEELVISIQYFRRENYEKVKGARIGYDDWLNQIASFLRVLIEEKVKINVQLAIAANYNNSLRNRILGLRLGDANLPYPGRSFFVELDGFIKEFCERRLGIGYDPGRTKRKMRRQIYDSYYSINESITFELKKFFDSTNFYTFKETNVIPCFMPYLVVNCQGQVLLCCADYIGATSIGNVAERTIKEILVEKHDVFMNKRNEKAGIPICRKCKGERTYRGLIVGNVALRLRQARMNMLG